MINIVNTNENRVHDWGGSQKAKIFWKTFYILDSYAMIVNVSALEMLIFGKKNNFFHRLFNCTFFKFKPTVRLLRGQETASAKCNPNAIRCLLFRIISMQFRGLGSYHHNSDWNLAKVAKNILEHSELPSVFTGIKLGLMTSYKSILLSCCNLKKNLPSDG